MSTNPYEASSMDAPVARPLLSTLVSFNGRVGRTMYWGWTVFATVVSYGSLFLLMAAEEANPDIAAVAGLIVMVVNLALIVPGLAVTVQRWHDRGKSGWMILIALIPLVGPLWALVELGFLPGESYDNQWGPPPAY